VRIISTCPDCAPRNDSMLNPSRVICGSSSSRLAFTWSDIPVISRTSAGMMSSTWWRLSWAMESMSRVLTTSSLVFSGILSWPLVFRTKSSRSTSAHWSPLHFWR
jgi:hypothetical protein